MQKLFQNIYFIILFSLSVVAQIEITNNVRFIAAGDMNLAHWITPILDEQGAEYPYKYISHYLQTADLVFSNLEAPFCKNGEQVRKNFVFKVPPKFVNALKAGNINLVSIANNHILDYGMSCLESTIAVLKQEKINFAGAGINIKDAHKPAVFEINKIKFAFFAYSMTLPKYFYATDTTGGTAYPKRKLLKEKIEYYRDKVDYIIVSFHWGQELTEYPKEYQRNFAHWAIDYGADLILGHHPHVLQGIEKYKNKLIIYSLANFVFASYSNKATKSIFLDLIFTKDEIKEIKILPINVNNYEVRFQPKILAGKPKLKALKYLNEISQKLNNNKQMLSLDGKVLF